MQLRVYYGEDPKGQGFFWPSSDQKRTECLSVKRNRPWEFQAVYQCNPGAREGSIFLESDFAYAKLPAGLKARNLAEGLANPEVKRFAFKAHCIGSGWDTAFEATSTADWTVNIEALLIPCNSYHRGEDPAAYGECEPHFDVLLIDLHREKLQWGDLVRVFRQRQLLWQPEWHVVEKKGSGINLYQSMSSVGVNVEGVEAIESKRNRAIQGVGTGSVQGWFRQHRVLLPIDEDGQSPDWVRSYKTEMKDFSGAKDATDDQVDATVHLVTKAIQLSIEAGLLPTDWRLDRVNELMGMPDGMPARVQLEMVQPRQAETIAFMQAIGMIEQGSVDPYENTCGRCDYFNTGVCTKHRRVMTALDSCDDFLPKGSPRWLN